MITSKKDYYSPVTALIESNMAIEIDIDTLPPPWTLVQGWDDAFAKGHSFLIIDVHPETRRVLVLESNSPDAYMGNGVPKKDGPQFRELVSQQFSFGTLHNL